MQELEDINDYLEQEISNIKKNYPKANFEKIKPLLIKLIISSDQTRLEKNVKKLRTDEGLSSMTLFYLESAKNSKSLLDKFQIYQYAMKTLGALEGRERIKEDIIAEFARSGALGRLSKDPKQKEKQFVYECWESWQKNPDQYKNKTKFASAMIEKFRPDDPNEEDKHLNSIKVITDWCREWAKEM